jgi:hypothetical protein
VIPATFHYRDDFFYNNSEVYVPIGQWTDPIFRNRSASIDMDVAGRLEPGITLEQGAADMSGVAEAANGTGRRRPAFGWSRQTRS